MIPVIVLAGLFLLFKKSDSAQTEEPPTIFLADVRPATFNADPDMIKKLEGKYGSGSLYTEFPRENKFLWITTDGREYTLTFADMVALSKLPLNFINNPSINIPGPPRDSPSNTNVRIEDERPGDITRPG